VLLIAGLTWIPVYAAQASVALALDVSGRMSTVVATIRAGHSPDTVAVSALAAYGLGSLAVMLVAVALSQGSLMAAYASSERGLAIDVVGAYRVGWRRVPAFLGAVALIALIVILGEAALYVLGVTISTVVGSSGLLTVVLLVGTVLPLAVVTPFAVGPQAAVLEGARPIDALRRSRRLLRGRYARTLGVLVVISVLGWIVAALLGLPVRAAGSSVAAPLFNAVMAAAGAILFGPLVVAILTALFFDAGGSAEVAPAAGRGERDRARNAIALGLTSLFLIGAGGDNTAIAINTKDNSTDIKVAFKIVRANGDIVAPVNFAFAYASCTSCETAAIAIEAVFVTSTDASVVSPINEAWAVNYACTNCQTLADAYQFTLTTGGQVHLTPQGNQDVAQIRRQLQAIAHSDMSLPDTVAAVQELAAELQQVLATQVVPAGSSGQGEPSPAAGPSTSPPAGASPASSPQPGGNASPSPSPSASASPSPSPS
jgi:putative peptide zinc metalloprotease protein